MNVYRVVAYGYIEAECLECAEIIYASTTSWIDQHETEIIEIDPEDVN